jgi:hypothetical protein
MSLLPNGMLQFKIETLETEFKNDLTDLKMEILAIVDQLVLGSLNCVFISVPAIASILVKWRTQLSFSSAGVTSRHRQGTLSGQRTIGCNTRGHNDEKTENMARVPNRTAC